MINIFNRKTDIELSRIGDTIRQDKKRGVSPVDRVLKPATNQDAYPSPYSDTVNLRTVVENIYVYACIKAIVEAVTVSPLIVQKKKRGKSDEWQTIDQHPLCELLARPNRDESINTLMQRWLASKMLTGNAYLHWDKKLNRLKYVKPSFVEAVLGADGYHDQYIIKNNALRIDVDSDQLLHMKTFNPLDDVYGLPPVQVIRDTIARKLDVNRHVSAYFKHFGLVGGMFTTDKKLTDEQRKRIRKEFNAVHAGSSKRFVTAILEGNTKYEAFGHDMKSSLPVEIEAQIMKEVTMAFKVPPVMLGILDGASYANAFVQEETFERRTCEPERCQIEQTLNQQLVNIEWEGFRVVYDRKKVVGLSEDRDKVSTRVVNMWNSGLIKRNEARKDAGYDPDETEAGEEYKSTPDPLDDVFNQGTPKDDQEKDGGPDGEQPAPSKERKESKQSIKQVQLILPTWKQHDLALTREQKTVRKAMSEFFDGQLDRALENIDRVSNKGLCLSLIYTGMDVTSNDPGRLLNMEDENKRLMKTLNELIRPLMQRAGDKAAARTSKKQPLKIDNLNVIRAINDRVNNITRVNESTWRKVQELLRTGEKEGWTRDELAENLEAQFTQFSEERALTIAQTETNGIINTANLETWKQNDVRKKIWEATLDPLTRDAHAEVNGQIVAIDQPFEVGGELLDCPGDSSGAPENIINCRCGCGPVEDSE